jgi:hypothetical protein
MLPLAQAVAAGGSFVTYAVIFVAIVGVMALVYIGCRAMGLPIPQWVWQALGVVMIVVVIIFLIVVVARVAGLG